MEEHLCEVEGETLAAVACHSDLSFYLTLRGGELRRCERLSHKAVEFASHESQTTLRVVWVAAEVYAPQSCVAVACDKALDGVDQRVALTQRQVEARVHAWSAEHVVHKI